MLIIYKQTINKKGNARVELYDTIKVEDKNSTFFYFIEVVKVASYKKPNGRPPLYYDEETLQKQIDLYFLMQDDSKKPYTHAGLAHFLGFESRQSLYDYGKKKKFSYSITRARLKIEEYIESRLYDHNGNKGAEFNLRCNYGWKEEKDEDKSDGLLLEILGAFKNAKANVE